MYYRRERHMTPHTVLYYMRALRLTPCTIGTHWVWLRLLSERTAYDFCYYMSTLRLTPCTARARYVCLRLNESAAPTKKYIYSYGRVRPFNKDSAKNVYTVGASAFSQCREFWPNSNIFAKSKEICYSVLYIAWFHRTCEMVPLRGSIGSSEIMQ